ncbi:FAS1-like dehydratase domain-containing protein [Mycobacterium sp. NPDC003323]
MTSTPRTGNDLGSFVSGWDPQPTRATDVIDASRAHNLAATLDLDEHLHDGAELPPLWQWAYFPEWPATQELGSDGHPRSGHFLPPIPARRRMFAGGRLSVNTPLRIGARVDRESRISATALKRGRSGELLFVTVEHVYWQDGEQCVTEQQDLVYRSDDGNATEFEPNTAPLSQPEQPWFRRLETTAPLLFRFSALTANAHRIHYDHAYTTRVEGFPALVVHGPLLALQMAELLRRNAPDRTVRCLEFRLVKPVFLGDAVAVQGNPDGNLVRLSVVSGHGSEHATARAELA